MDDKKAKEVVKPEPKKVESTYSLDELVANPAALGACPDIVVAALKEKQIKELTLSEAKKIVKEFKERKVY